MTDRTPIRANSDFRKHPKSPWVFSAARLAIGAAALVLWALWATHSQAAPCQEQPTLNHVTVVGGPFFDCGIEASLRTPTPTRLPHALEVDGQTTCVLSSTQIQAWMYPQTYPDAYIVASDIEVLNDGPWMGNVIFTGDRVVWDNDWPGYVKGCLIAGPGSSSITVDGICVPHLSYVGTCVPEPGVAVGLVVGLLPLSYCARYRSIASTSALDRD